VLGVSSVTGTILEGETKVLAEKYVPMPLCPQKKILHVDWPEIEPEPL